jgi:BirA family biotin operon repressor/biotin-[acetyl-CoA-carboxylase] ligase
MSMIEYRLRVVEETDSTNEDIKKAAVLGEPEGFVVRAVRQTGGKGRQGRVWHSPEGNLYVSLLLRPHCAAQVASFYAFVAALAVYDVARYFLPDRKIEVKWPNDVLVEDKKICGILVEAAPIEGDKVPWLVIGTGINIISCPQNPLYPATSLEAEGAKPSVDEVLEVYLRRFEAWRQVLTTEGFESLRKIWLERAKKGRLKTHCGGETIEGEFVDMDQFGRLVLALEKGEIRAVSSGDVL